MPNLHLTEIAVRALRGSDQYITYFDSNLPGFGVRVGLRRKTFVVVRGKNRERVTLGHYPDLSLADARFRARKLLANEPEPKTVPARFADAFDEFLELNYRTSTSEWPYVVKVTRGKHFRQLEAKRLDEIEDADLEKCFAGIEAPSARLHAFRILRSFFNWSLKPPRRYLRYSPMQGYDPPGRDRKGTRILADDELKALWRASESGSKPIFRLLILWGTRSTESTLLERSWEKDEVLTIPGFQEGKRVTKNGRDHAIPLLPLARKVLDARPPGRFYFPGRASSDVPLQSGSLHELRREIQRDSGVSDWGAHDLRRTFRSNMARLRVPREVCEVLINHAPPVLDEIYDRYDRLEEKREALQKYEDFMVRLLA